MKKYQIVEIISSGDTKETSGNTSTGYFALRCAPAQAGEFEFGDGKPVVITIFANQQPTLFDALTAHADNEDNIAKFRLQIVHRTYKSEVPFYTLDKDGARRTYMNDKHKDAGKDVIANNIPVTILDTHHDETNDNLCLDQFQRAISQLERSGLMVDLKDDATMEYEDYRARAILKRAGVEFPEDAAEETTEETPKTGG